nr:MAG TPA: hypothetical protein [Caudoviricetes sp.]
MSVFNVLFCCLFIFYLCSGTVYLPYYKVYIIKQYNFIYL